MQAHNTSHQGKEFLPRTAKKTIPFSLPEKERRGAKRYNVQRRLLSIHHHDTGQILDISRTGLSFHVLHFPNKLDDKIHLINPSQNNRLDILSPGLTGYLFRDLSVQWSRDQPLGAIYPENDGVILLRRSIMFALPLLDREMIRLQRFLDEQLPKFNPSRDDILS